MLEPPIATSSPVPRTRQWRRKKSKNNRRSISLLDVSAIQTPDVSSQKSESNETLTSVCKDSGYVHSEGSWLEDEESKESKDLVEELKFKNVLISELQESNRGLRMRCADAENKIWRLRIKCEEHCGCCHVHEGTQEVDEDRFSDSNDQFVIPERSLPKYKRHSLAVSKFNAGDDGYGVSRLPVTSDRAVPRPEGSAPHKPLVRSLSSGMIPKQRPLVKTLEGLSNDQLTPESLSLSKVEWWQRDLYSHGEESVKASQQSKQSKSKWGNNISDESDNVQLDELSALVSNDARMISRLVRQENEEEYKENVESNEKCSRYSQRSALENSNNNNLGEDICGSPLITRALLDHYSSDMYVSSLPPSPKATKNHVQDRVEKNHNVQYEKLDNVPQSHGSSNNNWNGKFCEDAMAQRCELSCCIQSKHEKDTNKCSYCSVNNVHQSQSHCDCKHPSPQIIIVPAGCCCRLMDPTVPVPACKQSCCPYDGNSKCGHQCQVSSKHSPSGFVDSPSAETLPLFVPKLKSTSVLSKDSSPPISWDDNAHVVSEQIPLQNANLCVDNSCDCATPCSRGLTVPLAQRLDSKGKMIREIEERMNKLASNGRAETSSLAFKPWSPPHFAEMSPLMRCLVETSGYARQMAMAFDKVNGRVQKMSEMSQQLNPSV